MKRKLQAELRNLSVTLNDEYGTIADVKELNGGRIYVEGVFRVLTIRQERLVRQAYKAAKSAIKAT